MIKENKMSSVIKESYIQYSGAVLQSRALVDVRDCLKPSARQIFYCMYTDNFIHSKPFKKTLKAIGSSMRMYIHGDSSCAGVIMRAGQPFSMRYPLVEIEGSYGNLMESGNWAAPRYTSSRLSPLAEYLFTDINKDTIDDWRDNYDDTEKYPSVLTGKGYYNIVNGTYGIGIGMGASIPSCNIRDVNRALTNLLLNPECDFEDIYCQPDFATGGILLNESEIKESYKNGRGAACKLRAVVEYTEKDHCLTVKEMPYGVYVNTVCRELEKIINGEENPGIERINDLTDKQPNLKIYINKKANPNTILKFLYKNTSLQSYYSINLTMLDEGRFPRVFGWREALQCHIDHEKTIYRRGYLFDLNKIEKRLHVIEGLLIALNNIDEVVNLIKKSKTTKEARISLQQTYSLSEEQAKAILEIKLSRLAHMETQKLEDEKVSLIEKKERIEFILNNEEEFNKQLITNWEKVAKKFGDPHRTKIMDISKDEETVEDISIMISLTNKNNLIANEISSLYVQNRNSVGTKIKLDIDEYIISTESANLKDDLILFSEKGNYYSFKASNLPLNEKYSIYNLTQLQNNDNICFVGNYRSNTENKFIYIITEKGYCKKSNIEEYRLNRKGGVKALKLEDDDKIVTVLFTNANDVGVLTKNGYFLKTELSDITPIARLAKGIRLIKLAESDIVVSAKIIPAESKYIVSATALGYIKNSLISEFKKQGRNTRGKRIQKININDSLSDFLPIEDLSENVILGATRSKLKIKAKDIPLLSKDTLGNKAIKLKEEDKLTNLILDN